MQHQVYTNFKRGLVYLKQTYIACKIQKKGHERTKFCSFVKYETHINEI